MVDHAVHVGDDSAHVAETLRQRTVLWVFKLLDLTHSLLPFRRDALIIQKKPPENRRLFYERTNRALFGLASLLAAALLRHGTLDRLGVRALRGSGGTGGLRLGLALA